MEGLSSAVHWWEESQLRVLVLSSMAIQIFLCVFAFLRRYAIPGYLRSIVWLAYLAGDAVAIYALATLFNRHKPPDHQHLGGGRGSPSPSPSTGKVELLWVPILLIHLGGNDGITAYNIEDNELWSRHLLTAVSQVTVAIYVLKKSWPPDGEGYLFVLLVSLFSAGIVKCFIKPWALKTASIYNLVSLGAPNRNEGEMYSLQEYVRRAKAIVEKAAVSVRQQNSEPEFYEGAPPHDSFFKQLRERLRDDARLRHRRRRCQREMLQRHREESRLLFVDLSSTYPRRLSILEHFLGLGGGAYGSVRQGLATAFLLLYTKQKITCSIEYGISKESKFFLQIKVFIAQWSFWLLCSSIYLFHQSQREAAYNDTAIIIDVKLTYVILSLTAVLEGMCFLVSVVTTALGKYSGAWPEMVAQYSVIGYLARSRRHRSWMWVASLFQSKDFLDQHWCMKSCSSSRKISELVLHYLKDGWKEISDAPSYHRFNDHSSRWVLERNQCNSQQDPGRRPLPFDECVLLWHIATDFCFFFSSSFSVSEQISASAEALTTTIWTRITEINKILRSPTSRAMVSKALPGVTSSSVDNIQSLCREMSNYMVYLLFVNPEMLLPGTRRSLFTVANVDLRDVLRRDNKFAVAYEEIKGILKDKFTEQSMYKRVRNAMKELKEILSDSNRNPIGWSQWKPAPVKERKIMKRVISTMLNKPSPRQKNFIDDAWVLAQGLLELGHEQGDKKMWEMIQGIWVEMLCYSASRCRGYLHAKALGNGGEFLSYVWLLLFHMGMETFTDRLQRVVPPSHDEAGNKDMADLNREEDSICADRLQREDLPSQGGNKNNGTASTSTSEICEAADDIV